MYFPIKKKRMEGSKKERKKGGRKEGEETKCVLVNGQRQSC